MAKPTPGSWFVRAKKMDGLWFVSYVGPFEDYSFHNLEHGRTPQAFFSRERAEAVCEALQRTADAEHSAWVGRRRG